ncbi:hypothetical protein EJB05_29504, partial [Eragrostis curvula]
MVMPCAHRFHEACLTKWLALSRLCPCCRRALPSEKEAAAKQGNHQEIEGRATRRSIRARRGNVRLSGPEWDSGGEDDFRLRAQTIEFQGRESEAPSALPASARRSLCSSRRTLVLCSHSAAAQPVIRCKLSIVREVFVCDSALRRE